MNEHSRHRRPAAFPIGDARVIISPAPETSALAGPAIKLPPEQQLPLPLPLGDAPPRRKARWGTLFWCAAGGLLLLAIALGLTDLVQDLFARSAVLGALALVLVALAAMALAIVGIREIGGLLRLSRVEHLQQRAAEILVSDDRDAGRALAQDLIALTRTMPRLARGRAALEIRIGGIIDGADLVRLTERDLMTPLDVEARNAVATAVTRVSLVTAVSSRASIDMLFVLVTGLGLLRRLPYLYGVRPGTLGLIRLLRLTVSHLAFTGGLATSDSLIQQILGHGIAAKLSARLGEGLLNGLVTARLGLAAIDVIRPLPFAALARPTLSDLMSDALRRRQNGSGEDAGELPHPAAEGGEKT